MRIQNSLAALLTVLAALPLPAQVLETYNFDYSSSPISIPDGNAVGVPISETISSSGNSISSIKITLNITGDFNGDLYFDLRHSSGVSVLLNRPGVTSTDPFGYADGGFSITLSDAASNDIHNYGDFSPQFNGGGQLTGEWQPDARNGDPVSAGRTAFLNAFQNLDPNGQWTLLAADLQNSGTSQLQGWGMELTVVPEPHHYAFAAGLGLIGFAVWRRARRPGQAAA